MIKVLYQIENGNYNEVSKAFDRIVTEDFSQVSYEETPATETAVFSNGTVTLLIETAVEYDSFYDQDFHSLKITDITEA